MFEMPSQEISKTDLQKLKQGLEEFGCKVYTLSRAEILQDTSLELAEGILERNFDDFSLSFNPLGELIILIIRELKIDVNNKEDIKRLKSVLEKVYKHIATPRTFTFEREYFFIED